MPSAGTVSGIDGASQDSVRGEMTIMRRAVLAVVPACLLTLPVVLLSMAEPDVERGRAEFARQCRMCHGADGKGNPAMARMLKVEFKAMDSEYVQKKRDEELKNIILRGTGKMVAVRGMNDQQVADVIAYVRSLAKDD
jgi:mono/diheme cytochrome c family protein